MEAIFQITKYISKPDLYIVPIDVKISISTDNG